MGSAWEDIIDLKKAVTHRSSSAGTGRAIEADPAQRIEGEKNEYRMGIVDGAFDDAKRTGHRHGNAFTTGKGDGTDQFISTPEHLKEKGFAAEDRTFITPMGTLPAPESPIGFKWVLSPGDNEAVLQGYYCEMCLQLQDDRHAYQVHGDCRWRHGNKTAAKGCGWNALLKTYSGGNQS